MRITLLAPLLILVFLFSFAHADDTNALINEALEKSVTLEVDGVFPQVMKKITDETAVPIEVPPHVYDLLPWGEQTTIKATIKGQTLRQALTALTHKLGLTWTVGAQTVIISPRVPLERLGRRATLAELETLDLLSNTQLGENSIAGKTVSVKELVDAVDRKLAELKSPITIEFRPGDKTKSSDQVNVPRNATLSDALRELSKQTELTWYPWGQNIVVLTKEDQIARQLDRTITKHYNSAEVGAVLADLAKIAGVEFNYEPGALQRVPPEFRKLTLVLDNARVREALEEIRGVTGLDYTVKPDSVYLWNQNPPSTAAAPAGGPIMGSLQLDNGIQLFLRAGDLPPDIFQYAEHKKLQEFKRLRQQMKDEQFVPTTQP